MGGAGEHWRSDEVLSGFMEQLELAGGYGRRLDGLARAQRARAGR